MQKNRRGPLEIFETLVVIGFALRYHSKRRPGKRQHGRHGKAQALGFGSFGSGKRAARTGRNPKTGETIKIPAAKTVKFTAGKAFKDAVNKR